ncbi:MAG: ABC transporter permease [Bacteroidales bacterium]|jgi:putative ABC transport system permease protein|nr:ABC transporter permease [Bacteroidales bacterium]
MNIFNTYRRTRFFLWINITGLAIGLAASILLILFVVNEWSYDKHFTNHERIVWLLTVFEREGQTHYSPLNVRQAYTELPAKVPAVEAAAQMSNIGLVEITSEQKRFPDVKVLLTDTEIFRIFPMKWVEGVPETALAVPEATVLTRRQAVITFGSPEAAMGKTLTYMSRDYVVSGVVEELPKNTHFSFDLLAPIQSIPWLEAAKGLEFNTYYLIRDGVSLREAQTAIEQAYLPIVKPWDEAIGSPNTRGETEPLDDVYLHSKANFFLQNAQGDMRFIWILSGLALFILALAVTNFINLFISQGHLRMNEIGIRKTNGASIRNIIRLFFSEVALIVFIAFVLGFALAVLCVPYFAQLINKNIDLIQLLNPLFITAALTLFALTVILSAFYPALYLSRFSPLEILGKRIKFSRHRLTAGIVVFQSVISIILLIAIVTLYKQTAYMEKLPLGYNPDNLMLVTGNAATFKNYPAIRQELLKYPEVKDVGGSEHTFGLGCSGQGIAPWNAPEKLLIINEYRLMTGMPELMELELVEGRFWRDDDPDSIPMILLNEAAVKMLGGESPLDKTFAFGFYDRPVKVTGIVKDFYYDNPVLSIEPLVLNRSFLSIIFNIRFNDGVNPVRVRELTENVFRQFDPDFVLNPRWSADIYAEKFKEIKTFTRLALIASLASIFVAMLGLLAIHLFTAMRRTKEIGIRRIHGAGRCSIFVLLSLNVLKWIGYAAVVAIPVAAYFIVRILENYANRMSPDWIVFVLPVVAQCVIALLATSGVSLHVLKRNPVKALTIEY